MTSTITLYKDSKIIPSRNFVVEGIETYLAGLTKVSITNFQYLRNDLNLSIKINKSQIWTDANNLYNYNYLKVSQNSINYYYFILKKTQVAESTIVLDLLMDTLNTYPWGTAFTPSNRTKVNREHKDRIKKYSAITGDLEIADIPGSGITDGDGYLINCPYWYDGTEVDNEFVEAFNEGYYSVVIYQVYDDTTGEVVPSSEYGEIASMSLDITDLQTFAVELTIPLYNSTRVGHDFYITLNVVFNKPVSYKRIIDYYSEGITPVLYKTELGRLNNPESLEWNLIYRNGEHDADAIDCFCVPSSGEIYSRVHATKTLTYSDLENNEYYVIAPFNNEYVELTDNNSDTYKVRVNGVNVICKVLRRSGTTLQIRAVHYFGFVNGNEIAFTKRILYGWKTITSITFNVDNLSYRKGSSIPDVSGSIPVGSFKKNGEFSGSTATSKLFNTLEGINRVDPKLIKIITIPYFPSDYSYNATNQNITTDSTWTFEESVYHSLQLNNLNTNFSATIKTEIDNPLNIFDITPTINLTASRDDIYESKLFHSDYYQPKFVYDSFGFVFELEKINVEEFNPSSKFAFEFVMTSTINSKFMFKFPEYILTMSTQDFDNILPVARNNEAPIYNSAYITYLTSAYRYDLKFLEQNKGVQYFNAVEGTIKSATGFIGESKTKGFSAGLSSVNLFLGLSNVLAGAITNLNADEWNLEAKKESLRNQANSVSGSDDLDLMKNYCGNLAKLSLYEVSPRMKKLLADLFYYFGYTTQEIKKPLTNTRYWFNFVSCELEFTGLDKNITEVCKENLIQRYNDGATFLHEHSGVWDFAQEKENWESSIL